MSGKQRMLAVVLVVVVFSGMFCRAAGEEGVRRVVETQRLLYEPSGMEFVAGKLNLEAVTDWRILRIVDGAEVVAEPQLGLGREEWAALTEYDTGKLGLRVLEAHLGRRGTQAASSAFYTLRQYAAEHDGKWPPSFEAWQEYLQREDVNKAQVLRTTGYEEKFGVFGGENCWGFVHDAPCAMRWYDNNGGKRYGWPTNDAVVLMELRPLYDDGKHLIVHANGFVERVAINETMVGRYGWTIKPLRQSDGGRKPPEEIRYDLRGRLQAPGWMRFVVYSSSLDKEVTCEWVIGDLPRVGGEPAKEVRNEWSQMRAASWLQMTTGTRDVSLPLSALLQVASEIYGKDINSLLEQFERRSWRRGRNNSGGETTVFGMLGGEAAVSETLQLQSLAQVSGGGREVLLSAINGVEVESHPYEEMLAGAVGGHLPLAELVPADRMMVYAAKPQALAAFLEDGAAFVSRIGATSTGRSIDYGLVERYLAKLGMNSELAQQLLRSGIVAELAIFLPDLFLINGTEVTLVCCVPQLKSLAAVLKFGNLADGDQKPMSMKAPLNGAEIHLAAKGEILILGSAASEVARAYGLLQNGGAGSLGHSAEFRYMLPQLPILESTRLYAYFSDSFIRRLVGPEVKIGQLRRMTEIGRLTKIEAARLLWEMDGKPGEEPGRDVIAQLLASGYLKGEATAYQDVVCHEDGAISSAAYGTLGQMSSLLQKPITQVTEFEAKSYKQYRDQYTSYWQQYFDPIAVRLDDTSDGELQLTTFILPLINSSLYDTLREFFSISRSDTLRTFIATPAAPLTVSFNVSEASWSDILQDMMPDEMVQQAPALVEMLNTFSGGLHIMVHDSNPVFAAGSGEMLALGGRINGGRGADLLLPLAVTLFTRPCTLLVELTTPEAARKALNTATLNNLIAGVMRHGDANIAEAYQVDAAAWIIRFEVFGINVRIKIELRDNMLLVQNIPWIEPFKLDRIEEAHGVAARALLVPGAAVMQQPAMFAAAQERLRGIAFAGGERLIPFIATGASVGEALARHQACFGFVPRHPGNGEWVLRNGRLYSDIYGSAKEVRQPQYAPDLALGVLDGVERLEVSMQFEDSGLRTNIKWRYQKRQPQVEEK